MSEYHFAYSFTDTAGNVYKAVGVPNSTACKCEVSYRYCTFGRMLLLSSERNVKVSDTTGDDSSTEDGKQKTLNP